jgi:hypothetical protein
MTRQPRRILTAVAAIAACLLAVFALSAVNAPTLLAADPPVKSPEDELREWLKKEQDAQALTPEQRTEAIALISKLGDPKNRVREDATIKLLLLPRAVVELLMPERTNAEPEVASRSTWLIKELRAGDPPAVACIARISRIPHASARLALASGGVPLDEILDRLTGETMPSDPRIIGTLFLAANDEARAARVVKIFSPNPTAATYISLYSALITNFKTVKPGARARLFDVLPADLPMEDALHLAEASADDPSPAVRISRSRLLRKLRDLTDPASLLEKFRAAKEPARRALLIDLLKLKGAADSVRASWVAAGQTEKDELVSKAFLAMACREGLPQILDARLTAGDRSDEFFSLLALTGTADYWRRVLAEGRDPTAVSLALTWLPYGTLPVKEQQSLLLGMLTGRPRTVRDAALGVLSGFGTPAVVDALLSAARAAPTDGTLASALSFHAVAVAARVPDVAGEPWFAAATPRARVSLLAAAPQASAVAPLSALLRGADLEAANAAAAALASRGDSFIGQQFRAFELLDRAPGLSDILGMLESPEAAMQAILSESKADGPIVASSASVAPDVLDLALSLGGHEPFRAALQAGTLKRPDRLLLLGLFPDDKGRLDLDICVSRAPEQVLHAARAVAATGRYEAVARALINAATARVLPQKLAWPTVTHCLARTGTAFPMRDLLVALRSVSSDDARIAAAEACSLNPSGAELTDIIESMGQRSSKVSFRAVLVRAAASAKDLTPEWTERLRSRWLTSGQEELQTAFAALDAINSKDAEALMGGYDSSNATARLFSLLHAARLGNRLALMAAFDQVFDTAPGMDAPLSEALGPASICRFCDGIPASLPEARLAQYWCSTRYAWEFDPGSGRFLLGGGAK